VPNLFSQWPSWGSHTFLLLGCFWYYICTSTCLLAFYVNHYRLSLSEIMQHSGQEDMIVYLMLGRFLVFGRKQVRFVYFVHILVYFLLFVTVCAQYRGCT